MKLKPRAEKASSSSNDCFSSMVQPNTLPPKVNGATCKFVLPNILFSMEIELLDFFAQFHLRGSSRSKFRNSNSETDTEILKPKFDSNFAMFLNLFRASNLRNRYV